MRSYNYLSEDLCLLSSELQECLVTGNLPNDNSKYVYLVKFKKFKNVNKIIYSYMKYNVLFSKSLLFYLYSRNKSVNLLQQELIPYMVLVDNNIHAVLKEYVGISFNEPYVLESLEEIDNSVTQLSIFSYMFKLNYCCSISVIGELMKLGNESKYYEIMSIVLKDSGYLNNNSFCETEFTKEFESKFGKEMGSIFLPIDYFLVYCSDLGELLKCLTTLGLDVNQGPQSKRGEVNNMSNFLSHLDIDYRNSLYYHNRHHHHKNSLTCSLIPRNKFSFKNIHVKLGGVRWYSSTKILSTNITRQELFQDNYNNLKYIMNQNVDISLYDRQKNIEVFLFNQEKKFSNKSKNLYSINYTGDIFDFINQKKNELIMLLSKPNFGVSSKRTKDASKNWVSKMIEGLGVDLVSDLLLSFFIEILTRESYTRNDMETPGIPTIVGFERFGSKLVNKYIYNEYIKHGIIKNISLSVFKYNNEQEFSDFKEDIFSGKLGGHFVGALLELNLLYQDLDTKVDNPKEKEYYLRIENSIRDNLMKSYTKFLHIPQKLPMICEPKPFIYSNDPKNNKLGGYLLNDINYTDDIFKDKRGYEVRTKLSNDNIVVSLINGLSKVPYRINTDTLEYIKLYGLEKDIILNDSDDKLQKFIQSPYNSFNKDERSLYRSLYSRILLEKNILSIADCFSSVDNIYFPVRLDQRTRIYCETDYFDYQKNDLAKGLISFVIPGIIKKIDKEVIKYFKGYGANMFGDGLDKRALNYKARWVDDNKENILDFRNNNIVNKAENKACFVSFCFEYERFIDFYLDNDRTVFYTYLPIQLDASCNGYQHLALLTKETKLFDKLNLDISTHEDAPDDFYKYILEKTNDYIAEQIDILSNIKNKSDKQIKRLNSLKILDKVRFDRSIVKKAIMTKSYNAGVIKQVDNIASNLKEHCTTKSESSNKKYAKNKYYTYRDLDIKIRREYILAFVLCLKEVLETESPKIKELSKYLDNVVKICTKLKIAVPWTLPTGAIIKESYLGQEELGIKAFSFLKTRYTFKKYIKGSFDLKKQKRATMPNLIHSLDGSTIALLYKDFRKIGHLYTVHDCFATTANNVPFLMDILKSVYLKLYSSVDYLTQFDMLVKININKQFGDKVYDLKDKFVHIPITKNKTETVQFPDINKVLNSKCYEKNKVNNLVKSSYTLI